MASFKDKDHVLSTAGWMSFESPADASSHALSLDCKRVKKDVRVSFSQLLCPSGRDTMGSSSARQSIVRAPAASLGHSIRYQFQLVLRHATINCILRRQQSKHVFHDLQVKMLCILPCIASLAVLRASLQSSHTRIACVISDICHTMLINGYYRGHTFQSSKSGCGRLVC